MRYCVNRRCHRELFDDEYRFCPYCGKNQTPQKKPRTRRPNGTGSVYFRKDYKSKPWQAASTITGIKIYIGAYATKAEAVKALAAYEINPTSSFNITLEELHKKWKGYAYKKLGKSAKYDYDTAWNKLRPLYGRKFNTLRYSDLQAIIDYYEGEHQKQGVDGKLMYVDEKGKHTYKVTSEPYIISGLGFSAMNKIKCLLSNLYQFAMKDHIVTENYATLLELDRGSVGERTRFSELQLQVVKKNIGKVPFAEYIYSLCYLNFRVSEFLELTASDYYKSNSNIPVFVGGKKTEAGTNRVVPIHPNIQQIVDNCLSKNGETVFCDENGKALNKDRFREMYFYPALDAMGLPRSLTPHSCRRTFSTRMSAAGARPEDIIALMGHTDFSVDIRHYINQEADTLYKAVKLLA
jgi:integrase